MGWEGWWHQRKQRAEKQRPKPANSLQDALHLRALLDLAGEPADSTVARVGEMAILHGADDVVEVVQQALVPRAVQNAFTTEPFPAIDHERLGKDGIAVGTVVPQGGLFRYEQDESCTGILCAGAPRSGKTSAVSHIVKEAQQQPEPVGVLIPDLRGDYQQLAVQLPDALFIRLKQLRVNLLGAPEGVAQREWLHHATARLTTDLGAQFAGMSFLLGHLMHLAAQFESRGTILSIPDLLTHLQRQRPRPRSSEEGYWERIVPKIQALVEMAGEEVLGVQRGFPIIEAVEQGRVVILDLRVPKVVADFITGHLLYALYFKRLYSNNPFTHRTVLVVLDEQRSLIREQPRDVGIPDIKLLFSRSRALNIGFLVAEQVPSHVSPAVLTSCRLRLGFNSSQPEAHTVARLLGLQGKDAELLSQLAPGQCIARLSGDRITHPFVVQIPFQNDGQTNEDLGPRLEHVIQRSLQEFGRAVVPRATPASSSLATTPEGKTQKNVAATDKVAETALPDDLIQVLERIVRFAEELIEERCQALRMDRNREWRARKDLDKRGLVESAGKIGKFEFFQPTQKGRKLANSRNVPLMKCKSGVLHEVILRRWMQAWKAENEEISFQRGGEINGVQPDQLAMLPDGIRIAMQVSVTNKAAYEVDCLERLAGDSGVDRVILVAATKQKVKAIERQLKERGTSSEIEKGLWSGGEGSRKKVVILEAELLVTSGFSWSSMVGDVEADHGGG